MYAMILFYTELGWVGAVASPGGLVRISLPEPSKEAARARLLSGWSGGFPGMESSPILACLRRELRRFYGGEEVTFHEPLDLDGRPPFFRRVWGIVRGIPWGSTLSYGEIARLAGKPRGARAVGMAMARNPVPPVVPCHRVLRSDGSLGGFGGGLAMKSAMLRREGVSVAAPTSRGSDAHRH